MGIILPNLGFVLIKNIPEYEGGMVQGYPFELTFASQFTSLGQMCCNEWIYCLRSFNIESMCVLISLIFCKHVI